jgi:hypothetical protein
MEGEVVSFKEHEKYYLFCAEATLLGHVATCTMAHGVLTVVFKRKLRWHQFGDRLRRAVALSDLRGKLPKAFPLVVRVVES